IYALGDVTGHPHSHHRAEHHARQLATSLVIGRRAPVDPGVIPVAVYTDPELAEVGLSEADARKRHGRIEVHRFPLRENVRAAANRRDEGHIKVTADRSGRILGASLACSQATELIDVWSLAISKGMTVADMAGWIAPHPTLSEINRKVVTHRPMTISRFAAGRAWGKLLARLG
ncbi:MAG: dihydrolipoamide dehydrogenase, partial [Hyphomicrobiaceae bacterium]|nr:dihydrolipoamide dehydrogenase [Hyphomicrobiaceae bacterium]